MRLKLAWLLFILATATLGIIFCGAFGVLWGLITLVVLILSSLCWGS